MKRNRQGMLKAKLHETSHFRFQPNNNVPCVGRWNRWYASIFKYKTVQCMKMRKIHNGGCRKQLLVDCSPDNRCSFCYYTSYTLQTKINYGTIMQIL